MRRRMLAAALACTLLAGCGPVRTEPVEQETPRAGAPVIAYVPLDDRPDNAERVVYLAESLGYELAMPERDLYRTRLTHTLEVSQIARTIARALRLNEDLAEAIAFGHDLGHTPFGHAGERALNEIYGPGFRHYEQSLRVVDKLERDARHHQYAGGTGRVLQLLFL